MSSRHSTTSAFDSKFANACACVPKQRSCRMVPVDSVLQSRCRLCLGVKRLQNSHLLPKALYRLLRTEGKRNPSPVWFNRSSAWSSSSQLTDQLLCSDCEQLFHRNGEDWVLRQCNRGKGRFRLQDEVVRIPPVNLAVSGVPVSFRQAKFIPTRLTSAIEIEHLAYLAASVIWRAGVHKWVIDGNELKPIDIREDQLEQLRRFLLGETGFPSDTYFWVSVSAVVDSPISVVFPPYGGFHDGHYSFRFVIPGIMFALFMGCFVPPIVPSLGVC